MSDRKSRPPAIDRRRVIKGVAASFLHGVASGDALDNSVIIWTRATPVTPGLVRIRWEVATDAAFDSVVASSTYTLMDNRANSLSVSADDLLLD